MRWTVDGFALCLKCLLADGFEGWSHQQRPPWKLGRGWLVNWRPPELGVVPGRPGVVDQLRLVEAGRGCENLVNWIPSGHLFFPLRLREIISGQSPRICVVEPRANPIVGFHTADGNGS